MPMNPIQSLPVYIQDFLAQNILKPECDCDFFKLNFEELKIILNKIYGTCDGSISLCTLNDKLSRLSNNIDNISIDLSPVIEKIQLLNGNCNLVDLCTIDSKLNTLLLNNPSIDLDLIENRLIDLNRFCDTVTLCTLNEKLDNLNIDVDLNPINTKLNSIQASINDIDITVDFTPVTAKLITIESKIIDLNRSCTAVNLCTINTKLDNLNIDVDLAPIDTKLNTIESKIIDLNRACDTINLCTINTKLDTINDNFTNLDVDVDLTPIDTKLNIIESKIIDLNRTCDTVNLCTINTKLDNLDLTVDLSAVITEIQDLNVQINTLNTRIIDLTDDVDNIGTTVTNTVNNGRPRLATPIIIGEEIIPLELVYEYFIMPINNAVGYEWGGVSSIETNDVLKREFISANAGTFTLRVKAISGNVDYDDSLWASKKITVSLGMSNLIKLRQPLFNMNSSFAVVNKSFVISVRSPNATSYEFNTSDLQIISRDDNAGIYSLSASTVGTKSFTVKAIGNGDNILDSDVVSYNVTVNEVTKLPTPILEFDSPPNIIGEFTIKIKSNHNAIGYYWDTLLPNNDFEVLEGNNTSQQIKFRYKTENYSTLIPSGSLNFPIQVKVKYIADGENYLDSSIETLSVIINKGKIPPPVLKSNTINVTNDIITIKSNENHNFYCEPNFDFVHPSYNDSVAVIFEFSADDGSTWELFARDSKSATASSPTFYYTYIGTLNFFGNFYIHTLNGIQTKRISDSEYRLTPGTYKLRYRYHMQEECKIEKCSGNSAYPVSSAGIFDIGNIRLQTSISYFRNFFVEGEYGYKTLVVT